MHHIRRELCEEDSQLPKHLPIPNRGSGRGHLSHRRDPTVVEGIRLHLLAMGAEDVHLGGEHLVLTPALEVVVMD
jgi:hypothetical protein